jgi:hypothetical protein
VRLLVRHLDPLLQPGALLGLGDVHVLDADRAAVRVAQDVEQVAELHLLGAGNAAGAIVASRLMCADDMPYQEDLDAVLG